MSFGEDEPMETAIEVRDLVVERGKRRVLHGISCSVPAGSVVGLLGPSTFDSATEMSANPAPSTIMMRMESQPCIDNCVGL